MSAKLTIDNVVGDVAAAYPQTRSVFEKFGIDYCCGGRIDLAAAAASVNRKFCDRFRNRTKRLVRGIFGRIGRPHRAQTPYLYETAVAAPARSSCESL
jgi:hypothetical protein